MIHRIHKTKNYTVMSNTHLKDKNLSLKAKGLLSMIFSLPEDWDYSINGLCAICKENKTAVTSALDELKEYGYLVVSKLYADKTESGHIEYVYDFYETPENQPVENLCLENQHQLNTDKSSKEDKDSISPKGDICETAGNDDVVADDGFEGHSYDSFIGSNKKKSKPAYKRKESLFSKCSELNYQFTNNVITANMLDEYLKVRLQMKDKPIYGVNQWSGILDKLRELAGDDERQRQRIIKQSIERGWGSFFEISSGSKRDIKTVSCEGNIVKSNKKEGNVSGEKF